jgi:hypothetical protein
MARNARYAAEMSCFVEYWERIHGEITGPLPFQPDNLGLEEEPRPELFYGEWPSVLGGQYT